MTTQYTHGPWFVDQFGHIYGASIDGEASPVILDGRYSKATYKDKRLIAAAPELLAALEGLCGLAALRPGHLHEYKAAIDDARSVINKAKGE